MITKTIKKFVHADGMDVLLPPGSRAIHVGMQDRDRVVWAEVPDENMPGQPVSVKGIRTGNVVPDGRHVGSLIDLMKYVWHFYAFNEGDANP